MKQLLTFFILTMISSASFASTAVLSISGEKVSHDIVSQALTSDGVKLQLKNGRTCLISTSFLKGTNTSGLDLLKIISGNTSGTTTLVIECAENFNGVQANNISYSL